MNHPQWNVARPVESESSAKNLVRMGYLCALFALAVVPIAFGIAAFVIGVINIVRGRLIHGVMQIVLAFTCALLGMMIGAAMST